MRFDVLRYLSGFGLVGGAVAALGPKIGLAGLVGLVFAVALLGSPTLLLALNLFANTSLQVLGSAHITGLPLSFSKLVGLVAVASWLAHAVYCGWTPVFGPIIRRAMLFLALMFVWDLFFTNIETGRFEGTGKFLQVILLCIIITNFTGNSLPSLRSAIYALSVAMAGCGVIGLAEHFLPSLAIASDDPRLAQGAIGGVLDEESLAGVQIKRITGGIGDANWLAYSIAIAAPLLIYLWETSRSALGRGAVIVMAALQAAALVFSYTRTGFLGLGVAVVYLFYRGVMPLRPVLVGAMAAASLALVYLPPGLVDRMFSSKYLEQGSTPLRRLLVETALDVWSSSPLVGHGYNGFGEKFYEAIILKSEFATRSLFGWALEMRDAIATGRESIANIGAHNLELELLVEYGLIGTALYFSIFWVAFRELSRLQRGDSAELALIATCLKAGLIAFLVCGLLGHAKFLKLCWIVLAFASAACTISRLDFDRRVDMFGNPKT